MLKRQKHFLEHLLYLCLIYFILWTTYFVLFNNYVSTWVAFISIFFIGTIVDLAFVEYTDNMYWNVADIFDEYRLRHSKKTRTIRERMVDAGYENSICYDSPSFDDSIIGIDVNGKTVYVYELMIDEYVRDEFPNIENADSNDYYDACEQAMEWINYNTVRATPYMGPLSPIIIAWNPDSEKWENMINLEDFDPDSIEFDIKKDILKDFEF